MRKNEWKGGIFISRKRTVVTITALIFILFITTSAVTVIVLQRRAHPSPEDEGITFNPVSNNGVNVAGDTVSSNDKASQETNPLFGRNVYFSGLSDSVLNKDTVVYLENLVDNQPDIYMQYEIIDKATGNLVYKTDLIPAGEMIVWVAADVLSPGAYDLIFRETPFWENGENYIQLTGGENEVHFTIIH